LVGYVDGVSADASADRVRAFRTGLSETGYVEGQNVKGWVDGQYERLPALMADLVRRRVAVIATPAFTPGAVAAKAATTIPAAGQGQTEPSSFVTGTAGLTPIADAG